MFLKISPPPGVYRNGTEYQASGRFYDANLFRWHEGWRGPVGGWRPRSPSAVSGKARSCITWKDNETLVHIAIGTETHLYAMDRTGSLFDITPVGFTPGRADASTGGGYGSGAYGSGTYGTPRLDTSLVEDATVWTLDTEGESLVGCNADDGKMYEWTLNPATPAAVIANSPTARSLIVTDERFLVALGAGGNPRLVQWADQENDTVWTPSTTNQAGQFPLQTGGRLMSGKRVSGGTLLFTDVDCWLMNYVGYPLVYGFQRAGDGCGVISQNAVAALDNQAVWMGQNGFFSYNGFVANLPCDVADYVFGRINRLQQSKVTTWHNSYYGECWWFYPSSSSLEIDSYVAWSYRENHWSIGSLVRLSAADKGVLQYPLMVGNDGITYEHEVGSLYDGATPRARTGPTEFKPANALTTSGDALMSARKLIPDTPTLGDVSVNFYVRDFPGSTQYQRGPYPLSTKTDVRFSARQAEVEFLCTSNGDRVGDFRLEMVEGSGR